MKFIIFLICNISLRRNLLTFFYLPLFYVEILEIILLNSDDTTDPLPSKNKKMREEFTTNYRVKHIYFQAAHAKKTLEIIYLYI